MRVEIHWREIGAADDEAWSFTRVVYAYGHPLTDEILYIGKAGGATSSVRARWSADDKAGLWAALDRERRVHELVVLVGQIAIAEGRRLSHELLADVESLLIAAVQPWGNICARRSRIARPGLVVRCLGAWPGPTEIRDG